MASSCDVAIVGGGRHYDLAPRHGVSFQAAPTSWTQYEIDIESFEDHGEMTVDDATPATLAMLEMCIDANAQGLSDQWT